MQEPEKRKYPRFDVAASIKFKKTTEVNNLKEAFVKNISAEGFCFYSDRRLEPGEVLEIEIIEKNIDIDGGPLSIKGEIVWSEKISKPQDSRDERPFSTGFVTGVKILGIRKTDEARFAILYCERMLAELKNYLHL